jgi:hypothetical protein
VRVSRRLFRPGAEASQPAPNPAVRRLAAVIRRRIAGKGHLLDVSPQLCFKAYLHAESAATVPRHETLSQFAARRCSSVRTASVERRMHP